MPTLKAARKKGAKAVNRRHRPADLRLDVATQAHLKRARPEEKPRDSSVAAGTDSKTQNPDSTIDLSKLESHLWEAANILRGPVDAADFKTYVLGRAGRLIRAISIRQPYVELILRRKKKREFRSRPTNIRERVWLYAAVRPAEWESAWRKVGKRAGELPTGVIVGSVEIVDCRWDGRMGCYAYVLKAPRRLARPRKPLGVPTPCFWRPR